MYYEVNRDGLRPDRQGSSFSPGFSDTYRLIKSAALARIAGEPRCAKEKLKLAEELRLENSPKDLNLEVAENLERAAIFIDEGHFPKAWDEVHSCMVALKDGQQIDLYLRSFMHALEAVCLSSSPSTAYAKEQAAENSICYLKNAERLDSPFKIYHPDILVCQARTFDRSLTSDMALGLMKQAGQALRSNTMIAAGDRKLMRSVLNAMLANAYSAREEYPKALYYYERAALKGRRAANLKFSIGVGRALAYYEIGNVAESASSLYSAYSALKHTSEMPKAKLENFCREVFRIMYPRREYAFILEIVDGLNRVSKKLYNKPLQLKTEELSKLSRCAFLEQNLKGCITYSKQAIGGLEKLGRSDLLFAQHELAFKAAFLLGRRKDILIHGEAAYEQAKLFSPLEIPWKPLASGFYYAAIGNFLNGNLKQSLKFATYGLASIGSDDTTTLSSDLLNLKAVIYSDLGLHKQASENYQEAIASRKESPDTGSAELAGLYYNLAMSLLQAGELKASFQAMNESGRIAERCGSGGVNLEAEESLYFGALLLTRGKNLEFAEEKLLAARDILAKGERIASRELGEVHKFLGDLYFKQGNNEKAFQHYRMAEALYSFNRVLSEARFETNKRLKVLSIEAAASETESYARRENEIISSVREIRKEIPESF